MVEQKRARNGARARQILEAVTADPGRHPGEYADALGVSRGAFSASARGLIQKGRLRRSGLTSQTRLFPVKTEPKPATPPTPSTNGQPSMQLAQEILAALGIERTPATLLGENVLLVGDGIYLIEKRRKMNA